MVKFVNVFVITLFILVGVSIVQAESITVGGQKIIVPSNYKLSVLQDRANRCWAKKITQVQTDEAAKNLPLACTELVIQYGYNWEKH
jgi:2-keto-3-deoxy-galactonokinase